MAGWKSGTKGEQGGHGGKQVNERKYNFKVERTLWGFQRSDESAVFRVLKSGTHRYEFDYELPLNLPCSFKHAHGKILYTVRGYAERPKGVLKSNVESILIFGSPTAQLLRQMKPITTENSLTVGGRLGGVKGTVLAQATIDNRVQFLGETAKIVVEGVNETSKQIDSITVFLMQKLVFVARGRRLAPAPAPIAKQDFKKQALSAQETYRKELMFNVPTKGVTPSIFGAAGLISVIYYFRVVLNVGKGLEVILPITLVSPYLAKVIRPEGPSRASVNLGGGAPAAAGARGQQAVRPSGPAVAVNRPTGQMPALGEDMITCPHCKARSALTELHCFNCGQVLPLEVLPSFTPPLNICQQCQAENEPSGTLCVVCGANLSAPAIPLIQGNMLRTQLFEDVAAVRIATVPSIRFNA